ncbi:MAG: hypothetical protein LBI42_11425 [Chitinispirillales bacterium]|jgi:hypothetical protein|nr:hypothetical protein [Chitinispirillales bacterium]
MKDRVSALLLILIVLTFTACERLDVVRTYSIIAFEEVYNEIPDKIIKENGEFAVISPHGGDKFFFGTNMRFEIGLTPFINAGLDTDKLINNNSNMSITGDTLIITADILGAEGQTAPKAFEQVIWNNRGRLYYHMEHDSFELLLGGKNSFKWTKDLDKQIADDGTEVHDLCFVLNPSVFVDAGADIENIDGWVYRETMTVDEKGKMVYLMRLVRQNQLR